MGINERFIYLYSFIYLYLLSAYFVSYTVLGPEDAAKTRKIGFYFPGSYVLAGEQNNIKI